MEEFEDFSSMDLPKDKPTYNNNQSNYKTGGDYKPKKPKRNIIGKADINLWDKPEVIPMELDTDAFKDDVKVATFALPSDSFKLSDTNRDKIVDMLKLLKRKNYKIRFIVGQTQQLDEELREIFGIENLVNIIPFSNYRVNIDNETPLYLVSDKDIRVAAQYVGNKKTGKGFNQMPVMAQYIYSAVIGALYGQNVDEPSEFYFTFDPFLGDGKNIDFTKSRNTGNYFILSRNLPYTMYNLANESDYADLEQILL